MNSDQVAVNILNCAIRGCRKQVIEIFGQEFERVLFHTLAELSKNHPDKKYLLYRIEDYIKCRITADESRYQVNPEISLHEALSYFKSTQQFKSDNRLTSCDDSEFEAVLEDFVAIVRRKLDRDLELKEKVTQRISTRLTQDNQ